LAVSDHPLPERHDVSDLEETFVDRDEVSVGVLFYSAFSREL
jgi:hypothetical protein